MTKAAGGAAETAGISLVEEGRAGLVKFTRPEALNALTFDMLRALEAFYHRCAKAPHIYGIVLEGEGRAFCAGGDIRHIYEVGRERPEEAARFFAEEYQHNWTLECFTKPSVALIDGIVMGGGVGASLYGTHRVAGANIRLAMPETGIGFFTDVGAGWFLPRMPGEIGMYLGLTGAVIGQADAYYVGAATHCIPAERFPEIKAAMIESDPIDPVLDALHEEPTSAPIEELRPVIDRCFSAHSVEEIVERLADETGEWADWAAKTRATLLERCPLSLKVTYAHLRRGQSYKSLKEALTIEYRLARRFVAEPEHYEGIRAAIIDKTRKPVWRFASLPAVSDELVQSFFEPLPEGDIELKDYWQLVA